MARITPGIVAALAVGLFFAARAADARGGGGHGGHGGKQHRPRSRFCAGASCQAMSDMLPTLAFAEGFGPKVQCSCRDFAAGSCFAPGCAPCDKACFSGDTAALAKQPGPFGTGLLCSSGCLPCCQAPDDPNMYEGSTCELPAGGCF